MRIAIVSLCIFVFVAACGSQNPESADADASAATPNVSIEIIGGTSPEYRKYSEEVIRLNNCGGSGDAESTVDRNRSVSHTIDADSELAINASGAVKIAGTGVDLGTEVAASLGYAYGVEETISRSLSVKAKPKTNMQHKIALIDVWQVGHAQVTIGGEAHDIPFSFHSDFTIELIESADAGCPTEIGSDQTQTPRPTPSPQPTATQLSNINTSTPTPETLSTYTPSPTEPSTESPSQVVPRYETNSTEFEVVEIMHENRQLSITILANNSEAAYDSTICWASSCRVIDENGNSYKTGGVVAGAASGGNGINVRIPSRAPFRFTLTFEDISEIAQVSLLEVSFGQGILEFYDINVPYVSESKPQEDSEVDKSALTYKTDSTEFEVVEIMHENRQLSITILANNSEAAYDSTICWASSCRVIDENGNSYKTGGVVAGAASGGNGINVRIPSRAPFRFTLTFEDISEIAQVSLLEVSFGQGILEFYDINVPYVSESKPQEDSEVDKSALTYKTDSTEFEVVEIMHENRQLSITILANNSEAAYDSTICWASSCRVIDENGNSYKTGGVVAGAASGGNGINVRIPSRAPFRFTLTFEDISEIAQVSLLEVSFGQGILEFYDINVPYVSESKPQEDSEVDKSALTYKTDSTEFEVVEIMHENRQLSITILANNSEAAYDSTICWASSCRVIDENGNSYKTGGVVAGAASGGNGINVRIPSRAPFRFTLTFEDISEIAQVSLLEVSFGQGILEFYDINVPYVSESKPQEDSEVDKSALTYKTDSTEFEVVEIMHENRQLSITILANNSEAAYDSTICWASSCRVIDENGNSYKTGGVVAGAASGGNGINVRIPSRAPFRFTLTFEDISEIAQVSLLEVSFGQGILEFYDVNVPYVHQ